jgi:hypothetical protein
VWERGGPWRVDDRGFGELDIPRESSKESECDLETVIEREASMLFSDNPWEILLLFLPRSILRARGGSSFSSFVDGLFLFWLLGSMPSSSI